MMIGQKSVFCCNLVASVRSLVRLLENEQNQSLILEIEVPFIQRFPKLIQTASAIACSRRGNGQYSPRVLLPVHV